MLSASVLHIPVYIIADPRIEDEMLLTFVVTWVPIEWNRNGRGPESETEQWETIGPSPAEVKV